MKNGRTWSLVVLGGLLAGGALNASTPASTDNPYQPIVDRNLFGLKPPPPPPTNAPVSAPMPKFVLNGFTTILNSPRVLLTAPLPAKPGEPAKPPQSLVLPVGVLEGDIEVKEMDEVAGTVVLEYKGTPVYLTLEKDAAKITSTGPPPGAQFPNIHPGGLPPGVTPLPAPNAANPAVRALPVREVQHPNATGAAVPQAGQTGNVAQTQEGQPNLTPEEAAALIEVNRQILKSRANQNPRSPR